MPEITMLPQDEVPKQITARGVIDTLGEHWVAFLAANNMSGWAADDAYVLRDDRFADVLLAISATPGLFVGQVKRQASKLKKLSESAGTKVPITRVNEMIAKALGYSTYQFAYKCRTVDDFIQNVWPVGSAMSLTELDAQSNSQLRYSGVFNDLLDRCRFNLERDRIAKEPGLERLRREKRRREKMTRHQPLSLPKNLS